MIFINFFFDYFGSSSGKNALRETKTVLLYHKNVKKSTIRYIECFDIQKDGGHLYFTVRGNGFLHHMVRIMVGTLLEVGRGERDADGIPALFGANRSEAGELVPACGLMLKEVTY